MRRRIAMPGLLALLLLAVCALLGSRDPEPAPSRPSKEASASQTGPASVRSDAGAEDRPDAPEAQLPWTDVVGRPGTVPEELRSRGDCGLYIRLLDRRTSRPVEQRAILWRLGLTESGGWSAGDQVERVCRVPVEGLRIENLAAGRYRVELPDNLRGTEDPPTFEVSGAETTREFRVDAPAEYRPLLLLFDESGGAIRKARFEFGAVVRFETSPSRPPEWARVRRHPRFRNLIPFDRTTQHRRSEPEVKEMSSGPYGFELGVFRAEVGLCHETREVDVVVKDRARIHCRITGWTARRLRNAPVLVGVAPSHTHLLGKIRLPDGSPVSLSPTKVWAWSKALPVGMRRPEQVRREVNVQVRVWVDRCRHLTFGWQDGVTSPRDLVMAPLGQ